jgi:hypothetical protein
VSFDPSSLARFSVIHLPYTFQGVTVKKLFVVIGHEKQFAFCIKTTTNATFYQNSPELLAGCICYKKGEVSFFTQDTLVQPENQFPIAHQAMVEAERAGTLSIVGKMPEDFGEKLAKAINASIRLDARKKARILKFISS